MRLGILENGKGLRPLQKLQFLPFKIMGGIMPGPFIVLSYRREIFGKYYTQFLQEVMRGTSEWSVGELELFASFTAKQLACRY
jgi:hypothetical protein